MELLGRTAQCSKSIKRIGRGIGRQVADAEARAEGEAAVHALFVCLDVAHLAAVGTFALRCLGLARGRGRFAIGPGVSGGVGGRGRHDAFGFLALEAAFAVLFEALKLVLEAISMG